MRYRLQRVDQVPEVPAWWNVGGNAFHDAVRWWEFERLDGRDRTPDEIARKFELSFADELAKTVLANPGIGAANFRGARSGSENREWWLDHGPQMAAAYAKGNADRESTVLRMGDVLALELGFTLDVDGIRVKGYIDQILAHPNGDIEIRDHKTGSTIPDDPLQLQVYAMAAHRVFGLTGPFWGSYWRARSTTKREAGPTRSVRLDLADIEPVVAWRLHTMDRAERLNLYPVRPSSFCAACGVRAQCPVMGDPATRQPLELTGT